MFPFIERCCKNTQTRNLSVEVPSATWPSSHYSAVADCDTAFQNLAKQTALQQPGFAEGRAFSCAAAPAHHVSQELLMYRTS